MNELNEIGLAYVAGLFDGEGYIRFSFKHHWHGRAMNTEFYLTISNTYRPVLEFLKGAFGGSIYTDRRPPKKGHKRVHFWRIAGRGAFKVLGQIAPYLKIKRDPANLVLKNQALISKKGRRTATDRKALIGLTEKMSAYIRRGTAIDLQPVNPD
jgi:hypothetical protein